jgi:hypothetical protein
MEKLLSGLENIGVRFFSKAHMFVNNRRRRRVLTYTNENKREFKMAL